MSLANDNKFKPTLVGAPSGKSEVAQTMSCAESAPDTLAVEDRVLIVDVGHCYQPSKRHRGRQAGRVGVIDFSGVEPTVDVDDLPVVRGNQSDKRATTRSCDCLGIADVPAEWGTRRSIRSSKRSKLGIDLAATVLIGPARDQVDPDAARSQVAGEVGAASDSRAAFATPIQSYPGQATKASKSKPTIDPPPPLVRRGANAAARTLSEYRGNLDSRGHVAPA